MDNSMKSRKSTISFGRLARENYCYVTTTGRRTGNPHEIEIWFGLRDRSVYLLSGGGDSSDWVKNMRALPAVTVKLGRRTFSGTARFVADEEEDKMARRLLASKYEQWHEGRPFSRWARTALVVAIELEQL
jgi:deazaflavin-dependent oxidoreductase (nitroreductase family)